MLHNIMQFWYILFMLLKTLFKKDLSVTLSCRQSILVLLSDNKNYHVNMLQTISKIEQTISKIEQLKKDIYPINCK